MSHHNLISEFNKIYYNDENRTWKSTHWLGTPIQKFPTDLWIYQELIYKLRPDLIVETGTLYGGSALFLATILEAANHGRVISVDISDGPDPERPRPRHRRLKYIKGSSTDEIVLLKLEEESAGLDTVMVILDSDHSKEHVLDELTCLKDMVTPGSYMIVEDTNINGHPVLPDFGPGPMEAVREFLANNDEFIVDTSMERLMLTANPRGYLRKKEPNCVDKRVAPCKNQRLGIRENQTLVSYGGSTPT
ncbi:MAG: CmcI family methyltransferase [Syntrophaceae bacterium]|nr:CmcI family methyltransferase [Syntrophaceae bacterium]